MDFKKDFIYKASIIPMLVTFLFINIAFSYPSITTSLRVPINKIDKKRQAKVLNKTQRDKNDKEYFRLSEINGHLKDSRAWEKEEKSIAEEQLALLKNMSTDALISELLDPNGHGNHFDIIEECQKILAGRIASGEENKKKVVNTLFALQRNIQRPFSQYAILYFLSLIDASKMPEVKSYAIYITKYNNDSDNRAMARGLLEQSKKPEVTGKQKMEIRKKQMFVEREYHILYTPGADRNEGMGYNREKIIMTQQLKLLKNMSTEALCYELLNPQTPWTFRDRIITECKNILAARIARGESKKEDVVDLLFTGMKSYSSYLYIKDVLYFFEKINAFEIESALAYLKKISHAKYIEDADIVAYHMLESLNKQKTKSEAIAEKLKKSRAGKNL